MMDEFHKQDTLPDLGRGSAKPPPLPKKIGPYKIENLLNKGGMSLLYLASHPEKAEPIAIKILLPKYLKNKEMVRRFLKEAEIIKMSNHPNIVKLYGQGEWEKGLYIAMEFIRGVSLRQFIQQKSLSQIRALEIILQVAYALSHLHSHGIIHRDLKPENILITENGDIKVIDFGIAQLTDENGEPPLSGHKMMGTPVYMSPEQKANPLKVTFASDIYSLGIIAYELILGRLSHGVIHLALLPKPLSKIIGKALKMEVNERYQEIVDFITDITQLLKEKKENREEPEGEISNEVLEMVKHTRAVLVPKKAPRWPQIEMGISVVEGPALSGLYLDFFRFTENRFGIVIAEPRGADEPLICSSILRGMFRMAVEQFFQTGKKDQHPIKMLGALSRALREDPQKTEFSLAFLLLSPDKDQLSFVSCDSVSLWHIADGSKKVRTLTTPNPPLGAETTLLETAENWNSGDLLFLHSSAIAPKKGDTISWVGEHLLHSAQSQADKIMQRLLANSSPPPQGTSVSLAIQRIF